MQIKNILILIGTIWPVIGISLAILIASVLTGWKRWLLLFIGPILFLLPCYIYFEQIAYNGNILFVVLMLIVYVLAILYYPLLMITGIVLMIKNHNK